MYRQSSQGNKSSDSVRRLSTNNPFRQVSYEQPKHYNGSGTSVRSNGSNKAFEDWVEKNKLLMAESDDDFDDLYGSYQDTPSSYVKSPSLANYHDAGSKSASNGSTRRPVSTYGNGNIHVNQRMTQEEFSRPSFPPSVRAGSDSSVNYATSKMSSNNPFSVELQEPDSTTRLLDPHTSHTRVRNAGTPPARPPKEEPLPPSYEEAAGFDASRRDYPREKLDRSESSSRHRHGYHSSRPRRSHSESDGHGRSGRAHRSERERRRKSKKPEPVKSKNLDTIDKLDVTAFFGGGFHHDGPFDACTPHRNKNVKAPPVMAFPADGPNNSIKGQKGGNVKDEQMNLAFGYDDRDEDYYSPSKGHPKVEVAPVIKTNHISGDMPTTLHTPKQNPSVINFDSNMKAEPIHGNITAGLGSSTFVDGAPAPRNADDFLSPGMNLGRKKSLVQRLRKSSSENNSRRNSNDEVLERRDSDGGDDSDFKRSQNSLLRRVKSLKVGKRK